MVRYAEYRKKHSGGIEDARTWVHWYHAFRRAQFRAENPPTFKAQEETAQRALRVAWEFNLKYCSPPLAQEEFDDATVVYRRWYFRSNKALSEELGVTENEALVIGGKSLVPS